MTDEEKIRILIQAKDEASAEIKKIEKELGGLGQSATKMKSSAADSQAVLRNMRIYDSLGAPAKESSKDVTGVVSSLGNLVVSGNLVAGVMGAVGISFVKVGADAAEAAARMQIAAMMQETAFMNLAAKSGENGEEIVKAIQAAS